VFDLEAKKMVYRQQTDLAACSTTPLPVAASPTLVDKYILILDNQAGRSC
jgi:hypothetical protein